MDIELEKLKKLEHALHDAIDILRDWQVEEAKSEEEKWIVYLAREENGICYLASCSENYWESVQKHYNAKTKLFIGLESDAQHWYKTREKFTEVIRAWEDGKTIQVYETLFKKWSDCAGTLEWYTDCEYRVKPECPCEDGIDSKACAGCEHSEDGKRKYKPYLTVDEFIQDFQERFPTAVPRPAYTMPLIWLKEKEAERINLCYAFVGNCVELGCSVYNMTELFEDWTYLDGSPVGIEVKE